VVGEEALVVFFLLTNATICAWAADELIISRLNVCDELRVIQTDSALHFVFDVVRTIVWLRCQRVEAVIDLEFFSKFSTLLSFLSRAAIRVGFHLNDFWRYSLVTHPIYYNYFGHIADVYEEAWHRSERREC
jgi:hypothetical protein